MSYKILRPIELSITVASGTGTATLNVNGVVLQTSVDAPAGATYDQKCYDSEDTFYHKKSRSGDQVDYDPWVVVSRNGEATFKLENANDGTYKVYLYVDQHTLVGR